MNGVVMKIQSKVEYTYQDLSLVKCKYCPFQVINNQMSYKYCIGYLTFTLPIHFKHFFSIRPTCLDYICLLLCLLLEVGLYQWGTPVQNLRKENIKFRVFIHPPHPLPTVSLIVKWLSKSFHHKEKYCNYVRCWM